MLIIKTFVTETKSKVFSINERICSTESVVLVTKDIACRLKIVILQKKKYVSYYKKAIYAFTVIYIKVISSSYKSDISNAICLPR